jgi:hypothetical protein
MPFFAWSWALILAAAAAVKMLAWSSTVRRHYSPAAAAGSRPAFFAESGAGLPDPLPRGLLLRLDSDLATEGGDLLRLSNLEARFGSGSF